MTTIKVEEGYRGVEGLLNLVNFLLCSGKLNRSLMGLGLAL